MGYMKLYKPLLSLQFVYGYGSYQFGHHGLLYFPDIL